MPTATTAGVAGAGAHAAHRASTARKIGEKVLKWQASQGCQRIPTRNSHDEHEKKLAKSFQDVLRRRYGAIGEKSCQQQLSADEIHFINGIPGVHSRGCVVHTDLQTKCRLSSSDLVDLQTWQRTRFRLACDHIWQFRLTNAGAKPRQRSDDAEEAKLAHHLNKLQMRAKGDIGEGTKPSQKKHKHTIYIQKKSQLVQDYIQETPNIISTNTSQNLPRTSQQPPQTILNI